MIALVGSGEYLPPMEPVDRELLNRLGTPARVVCLPTAAGKEGEERIAYWSRLGEEHFTRLEVQVETLPVIDRQSANDADLADRVIEANFVYLSGGNPGYLHSSLAGTLAWQAILSVLADGGILAGCSAGAMVLGGKVFGFPGWKSGFNLLPGSTVIPHYDEIPRWLVNLLRLLVGRRTTVLGIEGNTALVKDGDTYEVLGSGGVTVWTRRRKFRYTDGQHLTWDDD
jgi:cyanophycinase